jgi:hypothetical protein
MEDSMKNAIVFCATACVLALACNHESHPAEGVTTTGAGVVANDAAVMQLTNARCARAQACNEVGEKEKYKDDAACRRENQHDLEADLRAGECPRGIRQEKLANCVQEIRNEKCGNILDKVSRIATCRTGALCID